MLAAVVSTSKLVQAKWEACGSYGLEMVIANKNSDLLQGRQKSRFGFVWSLSCILSNMQ
jgi:hypothetical protein